MSSPPRLVAKDLSVNLGNRRVLRGVNLALDEGEILCVLGANGAGKSTLLKALAGLLPPVAGCVEVDGKTLSSLGLTARARAIAYLPQGRLVTWPISVFEVAALGRGPHRAHGGPLGDEDRKIVDASLVAMDLAGLANRRVTAISGGELARTLMARALAQGSNILLADEPSAGLDPAHRLRLFEHLAKLAAEGHAIAVAVHDLSLAARFATRGVLLHAGSVLAQGPIGEVLSPGNLKTALNIEATLEIVRGVPVIVTHSVSKA